MSAASSVEFGVKLPLGGDTTPSDVVRITTAAEDNGFDAAWHSEHIVFTGEVPDDYPYSSTGESPFEITQNTYDIFQMLSYLASETDQIRLGTNICIVPLRHPVILAKNALTVDVLSDGRFDFGVGVGWLQNEFEVFGVPFDERGPRTNEFLDIFSQACDAGELAYDGRFHSFQETGFHPRPVQSGGPPVWVGGESDAAFRRLAEFGDGWAATTLSPDELRDGRERILDLWDEFDRDGSPEIAIKESAFIGDPPETMHPPLVGSVDEVIDHIQAYVDAGATRIIADYRRTDDPPVTHFSIDEQIDQLERFGEEIIPAFST